MSDTRTATVLADDFMRAAANALLSACTDRTVPLLCSVHFRPGHTPGTLILEATNRYVASQEEILLRDLTAYDSDWDRGTVVAHLADAHGAEAPAGYDGRSTEAVHKEHDGLHAAADSDHSHTVRPMPATELDVLVDATDLGKLIKTIKLNIDGDTKYLSPDDRAHVRIDFTEGGDRVAFTLFNQPGPETTVSPRLVAGEFVKIDSLMGDALLDADALASNLARREADRQGAVPGMTATPRPVPDVWERRYLFNPTYLAIFTKVDPGHKAVPVEFCFTASGKPAMVKIGESYRALIVPIQGA